MAKMRNEINAGLLSELDLHLLAVGAQWWSIHCRALAELKESVTQISAVNGKIAQPEIAIAKIAFNAVRGVLQEFGVGPGSRTKVKATPEEIDDPLDQYKASRFLK